MKLSIKLFNTFAIILCLAIISFAQTNWVGDYFFGEDGGETAGGSKIYIAHTINITQKDNKLDAHIYSQGFQTSRDVYADVKSVGNKIEFYYREKGKDNYTSSYKKGDLLLTLEKIESTGKTKILTYWNEFTPSLDANEKSGEVYFEKQVLKKSKNSKLVKVETRNKELSFSISQNYTFHYDKEGINAFNRGKIISFRNQRSIGSFANGVAIWLTSYDVKDGETAFKHFPSYYLGKKQNATDYKIGEYTLREIILKEENRTIYHYYFNSKKQFYFLGLGTTDLDKTQIKNLLASFKFKETTPFLTDKSKIIPTETSFVLEQLKKTPVKVKYEKDSKTQNTTLISQDDNDIMTPMIILSKPKPGYTSLARKRNEKGVVRSRVEFKSDGSIEKIVGTKGLKFGLNEKAINSANRLVFLPPLRNGIPYSVTKVVPFNFNIY